MDFLSQRLYELDYDLNSDNVMTLKMILNKIESKDLPEYKHLTKVLDQSNIKYVLDLYPEYIVELLRRLYAKTNCKYLSNLTINSISVVTKKED